MPPDAHKVFLLQKVQPGLIGLIDGTISTLAPIFAAAYLASTHAALLVGLASALGAAISMGLSEGLSDDGELTGRGASLPRGLITGGATFIGGTGDAPPFPVKDPPPGLPIAHTPLARGLGGGALGRQALLPGLLPHSLVPGTI